MRYIKYLNKEGQEVISAVPDSVPFEKAIKALGVKDWIEVSKEDAAEFAKGPEKTQEEKIAGLKAYFANILESFMDKEAQECGYDSIAKACGYIDSRIFGEESRAFVAWRDDVWEKALSLQEEYVLGVLSGEIELPTEEDILAQMPLSPNDKNKDKTDELEKGDPNA